ncbi:MAG: Ig-like domain-containing protein [Spirochaetia bacterium]|nr:Ig-like domain-containing protein [Spirochaetota bacterium]MCX8096711.1 Ig-like domain-containing protein [Spirochaetota bacterium]MDW8112182.1 Ig-like domain-containing protein [Spirochaetia bacterium]
MRRIFVITVLFTLLAYSCSKLPEFSDLVKSDNDRPVVLVKYPTNNSILTSSNIVVIGNAYDSTNSSRNSVSSGISGVYIRVDEGQFVLVEGTTSWSKVLSNLSQGTHVLQVYAVDISNNTSMTQSVSFKVDSIEPSITILSPSNRAIVKNPVSVIVDVFDEVSGVKQVLINTSLTNYTFSSTNVSTNINMTPGLNILRIVSVDFAGNTNVSVISFILDDTSPVVSIIHPSEEQNINSGSLSVYGTSYDSRGVVEVWFRIVGTTNTNLPFYKLSGTTNWSTNISGLTEGTYFVQVYAIDTAGNHSITNTRKFFVDNIRPLVSIIFPTNNHKFTSNSITVEGTSSDQGSGIKEVWVRIGTNNFVKIETTGNWITNINNLSDGSTTLEAYSVDNFGNHSLTQSVSFVISEIPTISIISPSEGQIFNEPNVNIVGNANDLGSGIDKIRYRINSSGAFNQISGTNIWIIPLLLSDGVYNFEIFCLDFQTNSSITQSVNFVVDILAPSLSITNLSNGQFLKTREFAVSGIATDSSSGVKEVLIRVGNIGDFGKVVEISNYVTNTNWTTNIQVSSDGTFKITAYSIDNSQKSSVFSEVDVIIDTQPPTVSVSSVTNNQNLNSLNVSVSGFASDDRSLVEGVYVRVGSSGYFGRANGTVNWSTNISFSSVGDHSIYYYSVDNAGNVSLTQSVSIVIDTNKPNVSISFPTNNHLSTNSVVVVNGTSSDNILVSGVFVKINDGLFEKVNTTSSATLPWSKTFSNLNDGSNTVYVYVVDEAGNVSLTNTITFIVQERPTVSIFTIGTNITNDLTSGGVEVSGFANDNTLVSKVMVSTNLSGPYYEASGTTNWSYKFMYVPERTNITVYAFSIDASNNHSFTNTNTFSVSRTFLGYGQYDFWAGSIVSAFVISSNNNLVIEIFATNLSNPALNHFFVLIDITNLNGHQPSASGWSGDWTTGWGDFWFTNVAGINMELIIWGNINSSGDLINLSAKNSLGNNVVSSISYTRSGNLYSFRVPYSIIGSGASSGHTLNLYAFYGKAGQGSPGPGGMRSIFPRNVSTINRGEWGSFVNSVTNKSINYRLH